MSNIRQLFDPLGYMIFLKYETILETFDEIAKPDFI